METVPRKERRKRFWQQKLAEKSKSRQEGPEKPTTAGRADGRKPVKKPKRAGHGQPVSGKISRAPHSTSSAPQKLSFRGFRSSTLSTNATEPLPPISADSSSTSSSSSVDWESEGSSGSECSSGREGNSGREGSSERGPEIVASTFSEPPISCAATGSDDSSLSDRTRKTNRKSKLTAKSKSREKRLSPVRKTANSKPLRVSQSQIRSVSSQTGSEISETGNETGSVRPRDSRRYILFVGNLPFSAGEEGMASHFKKRGVAVREVRMLTGKNTDDPKGCCFVELDGPKSFQNALRLHHTVMEGRKINVELTCGGGGGGEGRRTRISRRNRRLLKTKAAQRKRTLQRTGQKVTANRE